MQIAVNTIGGLLLIVIAITCILRRAVRRNRRSIRERYAFLTVSLAVEIAILTLLICLPSIGYLDTFVNVVRIEPDIENGFNTLVAGRSIITLIGIASVLSIIIRGINRHRTWSNAKSERQFRLDTRGNWNGAYIRGIKLFFADALIGVSISNPKLKEHQYPEVEIGHEFLSKNAFPWNQEFAMMYSIIEPRAAISEKNHWFTDERCYIWPFDNSSYFAALVCETAPKEDEYERFIRFLKRIGHKYFKVIVAVSDNRDEYENFHIQWGGFDIDIVFKDKMLDGLVNFSNYFNAIKQKLSEPINMDGALSLNDIYTPLFCSDANGESLRLDEYVNKWLGENSRRQIALLGDYGQGKTTSALYLTSKLIESSNCRRIPIFIPLRGKSPRNNTPIEILAYFATQYRIDPQALDILNANGRLLLIFDGFDEMDYVGDWSIRQLHFRSIWRLVTEKTKMIITGRPNYFFDTDEIASALGSDITANDIPHCTVVKLHPFNKEQISSILSKTDKETREGILSVLEKNPPKQFIDLISRPSNLFLIVQIWKSRRLDQRYRNLNSASVIDEFLQDSYERQQKRSDHATTTILSVIEREYFMLGIALQMFATESIEMDKDVLDNTIYRLMEKFPDEISRKTPATMNLRNGRPLRDYYAENYTREAIITDIHTCGVLVLNDVKNKFEFAHKSFYDLLVAKCFLGKYLPNNDMYNLISRRIFEQFGLNTRKLRRKDTAQKKLLAELLIQYMSKNDDSEVKNPISLFQHCYRFIIGVPGMSVNPSREYQKMRRITKEIGDDSELDLTAFNERLVSVNEGHRVLGVTLIPLLISVLAFFFMAIKIIGKYGDKAEKFYLQESIAPETANISAVANIPVDAVWRIFPVIIVIFALFLLFVYMRKRFKKHYMDNTGVLFFTWYYALKDLNIADAESFSPSLRESFTQYIETLEYGEVEITKGMNAHVN